jgi:uncharacterized membrane protein
MVNVFLATLLSTAVLAPYLRAQGIDGPAHAIYAMLSFTCHQLPERSYFLFGYQMGFCQRDTALYGTTLIAGLAFAPMRDRLRPLSWTMFFLFATPIAVDGFTQLFGWRESTWELRTITGAMFALGWVWLIYPWAEFHLRRMDHQLQTELRALEQAS